MESSLRYKQLSDNGKKVCLCGENKCKWNKERIMLFPYPNSNAIVDSAVEIPFIKPSRLVNSCC